MELLPPNPKYECPDCKRMLRRLQKGPDGKKRCRTCNKKVVTNKFYIPPEKIKERYESITNFNLTQSERQQLYRQFIQQGNTPEQASRKVKQHVGMLRAMRSRKRAAETRRMNTKIKQRQQSEELNKNFKESLRDLK